MASVLLISSQAHRNRLAEVHLRQAGYQVSVGSGPSSSYDVVIIDSEERGADSIVRQCRSIGVPCIVVEHGPTSMADIWRMNGAAEVLAGSNAPALVNAVNRLVGGGGGGQGGGATRIRI